MPNHVDRFRERQVVAACWQDRHQSQISRQLAKQTPDYVEPTAPFVPEFYKRSEKPEVTFVAVVWASIILAVAIIGICLLVLLTDPLASANEVPN